MDPDAELLEVKSEASHKRKRRHSKPGPLHWPAQQQQQQLRQQQPAWQQRQQQQQMLPMWL